jgi:hypothetical protein
VRRTPIGFGVFAYAARHGWRKGIIQRVRYALRILLGTQDTPGAPIKASDILPIQQLFPVTEPLTAMLAEVGLLDDDRTPAIYTWFDRQIADLPAPMASEVRVWFDVLLHGSTTPPRSHPRAARTVQQKVR